MFTRRQHERFVIQLPDGREIVVELCGKNWYGNQRVGVVAPPDVAVFREEVRHLYAHQGGGERAEGKQVPRAAQEEAAPPENNGEG